LVEMLVSLMIGIMIILGAGLVYNHSRQTFEVRDAVAAATESSRFAIQDLRRTLVMAGRGISKGLDGAEAYAAADNGIRTFPAVGAGGIVDEDAGGSSIIAIRYASGPAPCGKTGTIAANTTVRFFVNEDQELVCDDGVDSQAAVAGVARMRALYGVDTDDDGFPNSYWNATQVQNAVPSAALSPPHWHRVVAIRIGLIINSAETELPRGTVLSDEQTLSLLGSDYDVPEDDLDLFHKSVSTTFYLRNLNAAMQRQ
jgi:type IV pilus assembly protein PilW